MTGLERRAVVRLIDRAVRERQRTRRLCPDCVRWLPDDEYARSAKRCRACDTLKTLRYRAARKAAA